MFNMNQCWKLRFILIITQKQEADLHDQFKQHLQEKLKNASRKYHHSLLVS